MLVERRFCKTCDLPKTVTNTEVSCTDTGDTTLECGHTIPSEQPLTPLCGFGRVIDGEFVQMTALEIESFLEHGFATSFRKAKRA